MMKILITGAKGQLGLELHKKLESSLFDTIATGSNELDITNLDKVCDFIKEMRPNIVINCAAYTNVDQCEIDFDHAYKINAIGARNLAIATQNIDSKIIHISTDYVFDGKGIKEGQVIRPYREYDTPESINAYGLSKLQGEKFVKEYNVKSIIIRTTGLYGEGNNFIHKMLQISKEREEIKVVDDQRVTPTSTIELTNMIMNFIETENYGLFHGTCEGDCTWYVFAKEIFKVLGKSIELKPCTSDEFPTLAKRPKYSVLDNYMLRLTSNYRFKHWEEALFNYLKGR